MAASRPRPRPRFSLEAPHSPAEIRRRIQRLLDSSPRLRGVAFDHRLEMSIAGPEHHFYSPQLVVTVTPLEDRARLDARVGPDPYVWAFYALGSGALLIMTLFATIFGVVQLMIGQSPSALFVAPGAAVLAGLVVFASFVGQGLGSDQIYFLRRSLVEAVDGREIDAPSAASDNEPAR